MWVVLPRAAETCIYISSPSSLSAFLFISLFLSIFLSSCNIFGMLRMYSDSICYESPEVGCITGAGNFPEGTGEDIRPYSSKAHTPISSLVVPFRRFFHNKIINPLQPSPNHYHHPKTLKPFRFLPGSIDLISRQIHEKGARGGIGTLNKKTKPG